MGPTLGVHGRKDRGIRLGEKLVALRDWLWRQRIAPSATFTSYWREPYETRATGVDFKQLARVARLLLFAKEPRQQGETQ